MRAGLLLFVRQVVLVVGAVFLYFSVRGLTEGSVATADRNAGWVLDLERALHVDWELGLQGLLDRQWMVDGANWIYIWGHWPVIVATLAWLVVRHRDDFYVLRNAMFISGAIGLVIFAAFPVTPPRLFAPEYLDTVTEHSEAYRILQPPALVNQYAAVPSLHFGWNLLIAIAWWRVGRHRVWPVAAFAMPVAMAFAVVATANHWTLDVLAGAVVAFVGLPLEHLRRRYVAEWRREHDEDGPIDPRPVDSPPAASSNDV